MRTALLVSVSVGALVLACSSDQKLGDLASTGGAADSGGAAGSHILAPTGGTGGSAAGGFAAIDTSQCEFETSCASGFGDDPGTPVDTPLSPPDQLELDELGLDLEDLEGLTAAGFAARYPVSFAAAPSYEPTSALGIDALQASNLALNDQELATLSSHGLTIVDRLDFPNFVYGYEVLYSEDMPLYVSADSILHAVHQSYDTALKQIELVALIPWLEHLLQSMRERLPGAAAAGLGEQAVADADLYLTVAASLLAGQVMPPVAGASEQDVGCILAGISSEQGCQVTELFGIPRSFDFSQFTVRGHYADTERPVLARYFKAMMWLGRVDFRLLQTDPGGTQWFLRRQLEAALLLRELFDDTTRAEWSKIDRTIGAFVGEHDSMTLPQLDQLLADLGVSDVADLASVSDQQIAQAIVAGRYGMQRICSHLMVSAGGDTLPLNASFLLFGQRYVVDSHVFSNVVFDRINEPPWRMMPNPLDAAFGALRNDQAGALLASELGRHPDYPEALASMRTLVDAHPPSYWQGNLYNLWIHSLRSLSPGPERANPLEVGLPAITGSEAWGRRILNTQLASWSELRHDTLLYAKQSYTTGASICEYPDAYVEPYPEFWAALVQFAQHGRELVTELGLPLGGYEMEVSTFFEHLGNVARILGEMAELQRTGAPHSAAHIAFINDAVRVQRGGGCGGPADGQDATGWYADLFLTAADRVAYDPSIADVHTQPTNEEGGIVGAVLHVATGLPRLMVVTVDTCSGPRAYVGLASSYFERVTGNFERITDERWSAELLQSTPADVPWMTDLVAR